MPFLRIGDENIVSPLGSRSRNLGTKMGSLLKKYSIPCYGTDVPCSLKPSSNDIEISYRYPAI